jgi:DNA-binding CsgD family transcriptional regulator
MRAGAPLSAREIEILKCLALGSTQEQICQASRRSKHTLHCQIGVIREKLGAQTIAHAVAIAIRAGTI